MSRFSKPHATRPDPIVSPRDLAARMQREALAGRVDVLLRQAGLNPISKFVGNPISELFRPLRPTFRESWRPQPQPRRATIAPAPTKAEPAKRDDGDVAVMDLGRWGER